MVDGEDDKYVAVELRKINESGEPTLDQVAQNIWIASAKSPFDARERISSSNTDSSPTDWRYDFADSDSQLDRDLQTGFDEFIGQELVNRGVVDSLSGISVYEIVYTGKLGRLLKSKTRFLVLQSSGNTCLYSCDNLGLAWGVAKALARKERVPDGAKSLFLPPKPKGLGLHAG